MSGTSDYETLSATSSETLVSEPTSTPSGHKIMGHADDEIREVVSLLRHSLTVVYETHTRSHRDEKKPKKYGYNRGVDLISMLENLGRMTGHFPEKGYAETVDFMIEIVTELSSMLAASAEDDAREELSVLGDVLIYKCTAKALLRATELGYDRQAKMFRDTMWEDSMRCAKTIHCLKKRDDVRIVAEAFRALVPKFLRSVSAIYGSSACATTIYNDYSLAVLDKLYERVEDEVSDETEGTKSTNQASGSPKNSKKEVEDLKYTVAWNNEDSGWQMFVYPAKDTFKNPAKDTATDTATDTAKDNGTGSTKYMDKIRAWCSSFWP